MVIFHLYLITVIALSKKGLPVFSFDRSSHNKNVTNAKVTIFFWIKNDLSDSGKEMMLGATQNTKVRRDQVTFTEMEIWG